MGTYAIYKVMDIDYGYLKKMSDDKLKKIVEELFDYEEVADIIRFTTIEKTKLDEREIRIICEAYESYDNEVQKSMFCKYDDFKKFYLG